MIESEETVDARDFHERVKKVKHDPEFSGYAGRISGLLEGSTWTFVCSEHTSARLKNEEALKRHFKNNAHVRSRF